MDVADIIDDLNLLSEDEQYEIKSFIQDLISKSLHQNKKEGEVQVQFVIKEEPGLYFTGYHDPDDPRNENIVYKYHFLQNRGVIKYEGSGDRDYYITVAIKDIAFLIQLNQKLNKNSQKEEVIPQEPMSSLSSKSYSYELTYNRNEGVIKLNGTKFHAFKLDGQAEKVFQYIAEHPYTEIAYETLLKETDMTKTIDNFLKDIKMNQLMRELFFPRTNNKKIYFRPGVEIEVLSQK